MEEPTRFGAIEAMERCVAGLLGPLNASCAVDDEAAEALGVLLYKAMHAPPAGGASFGHPTGWHQAGDRGRSGAIAMWETDALSADALILQCDLYGYQAMHRWLITAVVLAVVACGGDSGASTTLEAPKAPANSSGAVANGALSCPSVFTTARAVVPAALEITEEQAYYPTCRAETADGSTIVIVALDPRPMNEIRAIVERGCEAIDALEDCGVDDAGAEFGGPAFWLHHVSYSATATATVRVQHGTDVLMVSVQRPGTDPSTVEDEARTILGSIT